jgi:soluble lytic murein transglycosylase-like protein
MAFVRSVNYTSDIEFYEAIAKAKAAQTTRENALQELEATSAGLSFQSILQESSTAYQNETTISNSDLDTYFQEAADTYGISVDLLKAVAWQESNYQTDIVSSAGAIGVMQLMPSTASYLGVSDPYDAESNILGGAKLLAQLSEHYNGDLDLTLAAYNAGSGAVDSYGGIPPYTETQNFVASIKSRLGLTSS